MPMFSCATKESARRVAARANGASVSDHPFALNNRWHGSNGPCKVAVLKHGRGLRVVCTGKDQPIPYTLDEPAQGQVAVRFRSGATEYCALFGAGSIEKDEAGGVFRATNAPAPALCPPAPRPCPRPLFHP
jgi:hypothetical protein